ncbi:type I toxin-antitoxin system toxin Ldr family protein [Escherichia coli]
MLASMIVNWLNKRK